MVGDSVPIFTARSERRKVLFLSLSVTYFVCVCNISGTAERICVRFTRKTCLVRRSDDFECQGQMSRSLGTKTVFFGPLERPACGLFDKTSLAKPRSVENLFSYQHSKNYRNRLRFDKLLQK